MTEQLSLPISETTRSEYISALADALCWVAGYREGAKDSYPDIPIDIDGLREMKWWLSTKGDLVESDEARTGQELAGEPDEGDPYAPGVFGVVAQHSDGEILLHEFEAPMTSEVNAVRFADSLLAGRMFGGPAIRTTVVRLIAVHGSRKLLHDMEAKHT